MTGEHEHGAGGGPIPDGARAVVRVAGCDRVGIRDKAPGGFGHAYLYKLRLEVVGGPFAGRPALRHCFHTAGGFRRMTADLAAFGLVHPEQVCGGPPPGGYRAAAGLAPQTDQRTGEPYTAAVWLAPLADDPPRPGRGGPAATTAAF